MAIVGMLLAGAFAWSVNVFLFAPDARWWHFFAMAGCFGALWRVGTTALSIWYGNRDEAFRRKMEGQWTGDVRDYAKYLWGDTTLRFGWYGLTWGTGIWLGYLVIDGLLG
ncbi:MAG: hypothetical protein F4Y86_17880 [Gammaproteobacteria bacterium]|nr:hypothetical protein [Gammaproteobacteria bacterium]